MKARAHGLAPAVFVGQSGLTDAVVAEVDRALTAHGLIKVKVNVADRGDRAAISSTLCDKTGAASVQSVGKVVVLWRPTGDEDDSA